METTRGQIPVGMAQGKPTIELEAGWGEMKVHFPRFIILSQIHCHGTKRHAAIPKFGYGSPIITMDVETLQRHTQLIHVNLCLISHPVCATNI